MYYTYGHPLSLHDALPIWQLRETARDDLVSVFILPPSTTELERRLHARAQDSDEVVRGRMAKAADEMSHWAEYDYIIINDNLESSVAPGEEILHAERLTPEHRVGLRTFVERVRTEKRRVGKR